MSGAATILQKIFQSTPPARGATRGSYVLVEGTPKISIHAPREGGDPAPSPSAGSPTYFNPRPPRGGRRGREIDYEVDGVFQSTPPARGATQM